MTAGFQLQPLLCLRLVASFQQSSKSLLLCPSQIQAGLSRQRDSMPNGLDLSLAERKAFLLPPSVYLWGRTAKQSVTEQTASSSRTTRTLCHFLCMSFSIMTQAPLPRSPSRLLSSLMDCGTRLWSTNAGPAHSQQVPFGNFLTSLCIGGVHRGKHKAHTSLGGD